ncbi:MAG TPA: outer membrane beta-barrel protein, partial [Gemmataceae bacterium]|nr:outer membrane beta-barrel protein [Gemmataceae bacterium]
MLASLLVGLTITCGQAPSSPIPAPPPVFNYSPSPPQAFNNGSPPSSALVLPQTNNPSTPAPYDSQPTQIPSDPSTQDGNGNGSNNAPQEPGSFAQRFLSEYDLLREWFPNWLGKPENGNDENQLPPARRGLPAPMQSPPFPSSEWQGYPVVGVPYDSTTYPLMAAIYKGPWGDEIKQSRVKIYGWVNASGNWSTSTNSNTPDSYWIVPNSLQLDQIVLRAERLVDSVQQDHISVGFRSTFLFGIDYRYMTAGGWTSYQLLELNNLYGYDLTEQYIDVYFPGIAKGLIMRVGRWIACPDIETQFAPDNYLGTHSLLFTFDTYTQTGIMLTLMLNDQWQVQACIRAGTDMAP